MADNNATLQREVLFEGRETFFIAFTHAARGFHLDRDLITEQEIDLKLRMCAPITEGKLALPIREKGAQFKKDQMLESGTIQFTLRSYLEPL